MANNYFQMVYYKQDKMWWQGERDTDEVRPRLILAICQEALSPLRCMKRDRTWSLTELRWRLEFRATKLTRIHKATFQTIVGKTEKEHWKSAERNPWVFGQTTLHTLGEDEYQRENDYQILGRIWNGNKFQLATVERLHWTLWAFLRDPGQASS